MAIASQRSPEEIRRLLQLHDLPQLTVVPGEAHTIKPADLIAAIANNIEQDLAFLSRDFVRPKKLLVEGDRRRVFLHRTAQVSPHAVLESSEGPIVIDAGAKVAALSFVRGPAYIGPGTVLDQCRFSHSIAGRQCRLGGEIANSIIGDFSNKHHEGFLGHSLVGDWVNLGALTTTSDLKNNYGEVRLQFAGAIYPTGTIKFGAVIGDYAKTAIGTLLNTGSIIGFGANLFGESRWGGHVPNFAWGGKSRYELEHFLRDAARMMQRRNQRLSPALVEAITLLYRQ